MGTMVAIRLITKTASSLYTGREGSPEVVGIVGLSGVAKKYGLMNKASKLGCPFAKSALPLIGQRIAEVTLGITVETDRIRSLPKLIAVEGEPDRHYIHDVTKFESKDIKRILHAIVKLDELVHEAYKARLGGAISKKESYSIGHRHRKKLFALMFYIYQYDDYKFRGKDKEHRHSNEWKYMVFRFGEPGKTMVNHVVQVSK